MRKNYFITLLCTLFLTSFAFGQIWEEDFESYAENTGIEGDGSGNVANVGDYPGSVTKWTLDATNAALFNSSDFAKTIGGVMSFRDTDGDEGVYWESESIDISGATGNVSFQLTVSNNGGGFESSDLINVWYSIDGGAFTLIANWNGLGDANTTILGESGGNDWDSVETILQSGISGNNLVIKAQFLNSAGPEQFFLDDVSVFEGSAPPSISFTNPTNGTVFSPETTDVPMTFNVNNFTLSGDAGGGVSDNTGDGYILGTAVENGVTETQNIFNVNESIGDLEAGDSVTLTVELVDNSGNSLTPPVSASVSFTVASYTQVADIAALRAGTEGDYYELTGEAIMTVDAMNSRNQKYIQDTSAAILIDDNDGVIATSYNVGDGITGIKGRLGSFGQVLQFIPEVDPGAATTTGNTVTPQVVTIADLNANLNDYESELIKINDVNFTTADGTEAFGSGNGNYDITDGTNTLVFRLNWSTDINGTVIPTSSANITGIAAEFNGTSQIFGISLADIVLGVEINEILGYTAYPNPVKGNQLTISSNSLDTKTVAIYNVLGKKVFTRTFSGAQDTFDVSNVASGIYILKVTEGNRISTQKLIIE